MPVPPPSSLFPVRDEVQESPGSIGGRAMTCIAKFLRSMANIKCSLELLSAKNLWMPLNCEAGSAQSCQKGYQELRRAIALGTCKSVIHSITAATDYLVESAPCGMGCRTG